MTKANTAIFDKFYRALCVFATYGAHSVLMTISFIVLAISLGILLDQSVENPALNCLMSMPIAVAFGVRFALLIVPPIRKSVCSTMGWTR